MIAEQSQGIPRKINSLCFSALSLGCAMDRKQIDAEMMEEVIADRDVESLQRPKAAARVASPPMAQRPILSSPMISRPAMFSHQAQPRKSFGGWALGAATIALSVAIGIGILSFSPGGIDRSLEQSFRSLDGRSERHRVDSGLPDREIRFGAGLFASECSGCGTSQFRMPGWPLPRTTIPRLIRSSCNRERSCGK